MMVNADLAAISLVVQHVTVNRLLAHAVGVTKENATVSQFAKNSVIRLFYYCSLSISVDCSFVQLYLKVSKADVKDF